MINMSTRTVFIAMLSLMLIGPQAAYSPLHGAMDESELIEPQSDLAPAIVPVLSWLECEECTNSELKTVVRLGAKAVPLLSLALCEGPSQASRELYRRELTANYLKLASQHDQSKPTLNLKDYLATNIENYTRLYRVRALTALSIMGGKSATAALRDECRQQLPKEIKMKIHEILADRE